MILQKRVHVKTDDLRFALSQAFEAEVDTTDSGPISVKLHDVTAEEKLSQSAVIATASMRNCGGHEIVADISLEEARQIMSKKFKVSTDNVISETKPVMVRRDRGPDASGEKFVGFIVRL